VNNRRRIIATVHGPSGLNGTGEAQCNARLIAEAQNMRAELANLAAWLVAPDTRRTTLNVLQDSIRELLARIDGVTP
jgi:hypothetical protein